MDCLCPPSITIWLLSRWSFSLRTWLCPLSPSSFCSGSQECHPQQGYSSGLTLLVVPFLSPLSDSPALFWFQHKQFFSRTHFSCFPLLDHQRPPGKTAGRFSAPVSPWFKLSIRVFTLFWNNSTAALKLQQLCETDPCVDSSDLVPVWRQQLLCITLVHTLVFLGGMRCRDSLLGTQGPVWPWDNIFFSVSLIRRAQSFCTMKL